MKRKLIWKYVMLSCSILLFLSGLVSCKKTENPIKFSQGIFPDSTFNFTDINSAYDDYNCTVYELSGDITIVFSSNRGSSGGQFDLVQGELTFTFDQTDGAFEMKSDIINDAFLSKLLKASNTSGNDFGPYRFFSSLDGYEYLLLASVNTAEDLDFYYLKNRALFGNNLPEVLGPYPISLLNTASDDAYICFDYTQDTLYFSTNTGGNFDIYMKKRPAKTDLTEWFSSSYSASAAVDSINSSGDDKCPFVSSRVMVFASNKPGGLGGYDLYYSFLRNGKWGYPVNFGPDVNTLSNEYRPILTKDDDFTNTLMIFSSDRPGGKGGYDLYFRGVSFPID